MQSEHKTQIYLSSVQYKALRSAAAAEDRSMASIVRDAVDAYLEARTKARWQGDPIGRIVGLAEGGADDSDRIDDELYGGM